MKYTNTKTAFIVLLCIPLLASYQDSWKGFKFNSGNFSVSFPSEPKAKSGKPEGWSATDKNGQVTYMVTFMNAPQGEIFTAQLVEDFLITAMFKGDIKVSQSRSTYQGSTTVEFLYKQTDAPTLYKKGRVVITPKTAYVLQVLYYHSDLAYSEKFFNSLILNK